MTRWLLLLTACAMVPVALADNVGAVIDSCIHRLDPTLDVGYARIAERCPDLPRSLAASPYAPWLPADWSKPDNDLSVGGLVELRRLLTRPEPSPVVRAPRVAQLAGVLSELQRDDTAKHNWWQRFKQWLREILTPPPREAGQGWLERLIGGIDLSQGVMRAIVWGALALVLLLAGAVVVNELRVAGWWRRRRRRGGYAPAGAAVRRSTADLEELERAPAEEQPHLLLQLIIRCLLEQRLLPPASALTLSELERAARLRESRDRERLAALTAACERARFAEDLSAPLLSAALVRGRELLAALQRPRAQPSGSA